MLSRLFIRTNPTLGQRFGGSRAITQHSPQINQVTELDFVDHEKVFRQRTTKELLRSLAILRLCSVNLFVDNALSVMTKCEKLFGKRLFSMVARPTFYAQFVGGDSEEELRLTMEKLAATNLHLMVCPAMEEDEGESGDLNKYQANMEYISNIGSMMRNSGEESPCLQFKVTAMMPGDLVTKLASNIGVNITLEDLAEKIASSMETGNQLRLDWLTTPENEQLNDGVLLIKKFAHISKAAGIRLLVDAEYTYMNPGISAVALAMMFVFNKESPVVWNTYQCYLKEAFNTISAELQIVEKRNRCFGAKIVRGAYMEKERKMASVKGYTDPVNDNYEATGKMYDRVALYMMEHIQRVGDRCNIVLGTHNEASVLTATARLTQLDINPQSGRVVFGQIYGMADQISVPLAAAGFKVYKSVPYGPLDEVLPYLSRRAAENRVVLSGARKELELLLKELRRRVTFAS